jgi:hypothetical protein
MQRRLRLQQLEDLRVNAAEAHATAASVRALHTGETQFDSLTDPARAVP